MAWMKCLNLLPRIFYEILAPIQKCYMMKPGRIADTDHQTVGSARLSLCVNGRIVIAFNQQCILVSIMGRIMAASPARGFSLPFWAI
jgi:hypothetical protein